MSELEARKYISIYNLRAEIRQDMEDYKLFRSVADYVSLHIASILSEKENNYPSYYKRAWFMEYLSKQIDDNISKLKELVEQNNE